MASLIPAAGSTGSGSLTLQGPSTSSTQTVTIPDATGTMMVSGNMPAFSAYASSNTSLTANTATLIGFQTKVWDTATCYNNTGSTVTLNGLSVPAYAFCPNVAGYYQINGGWTTNSASAQSFYISPYKNGSLYIYGNWQTGSSIGGVAICSSLIYLNGTGDYVQLYAVDSLTVGTTTGQQYTYFQASLVRAA